jgi:hypothetical protein
MKLITVLTLSLAFVESGAFSSLRAQDAAVASASEVHQCVEWMKATVSASAPDPTEFCSGIWDGNLDRWHSVYHECRQPNQQLTGAAPRYCASSGQVSAREAWAVGFSSTTRDGHDLLGGLSDFANNSQKAAATFYSRTAVWMENLRVPAGMYKLVPSRSAGGWSLAVAKLDGEWNDGRPQQQYLGSVQMRGSASENATGKSIVGISTRSWAEGCPGPSRNHDIRELHFFYGTTNLFVCVRPDQVWQNQETNMSER